MKLIVGLGNPGKKYGGTRHNVGFLAVDFLAKSNSLDFSDNLKFKSEIATSEKFILVKPHTFMNNSGDAVSAIANFYKVSIEDIYVIHDDLDLRLGEYKIQKTIGPKVHRGINSIEEKLGSKNFWRVRIGVDNRSIENRIAGEEYVLQSFSEFEKEVVDAIIEKAIQDLEGQIQ